MRFDVKKITILEYNKNVLKLRNHQIYIYEKSKKIDRESLKLVKGGTKEGCPGPKSPGYHPYATQEQCENATGTTCTYSEETYCFPAGWNTGF